MKRLLYIFCLLVILSSCTDETKVQSVRLNPEELSLNIGEVKQIEMLISPISAIKYNPTAWESSDPAVAVVDDNGYVKGIYAGECLITGKAMHKEGYCKVKVLSPSYDLKFDKVIIFRNDVEEAKDTRNYILRLYQESLNIDSLGNTSGNGLFLNINLYTDSEAELIPDGNYTVKNDSTKFSIVPGALSLIDGSYYATGSYLGQYTVNGLSALYITEGNCTIQSDTYFCANCSFLGEKTEKISAIFNGIPRYYDGKDDENSNFLRYNSVKTLDFEVRNEPDFNHSKIIFNVNDTIIEFICRHPKSTDCPPTGNYHMTSTPKNYSILSPDNTNNCLFIENRDSTVIKSAKLQISSTENTTNYSATFSTAKNQNFILMPQSRKSNISKMKIK